MKTLAFAITLLFALVLGRAALAFTPPPINGHVTDTAGKLAESDRLALDHELEDYRLRTTNQIAVFIPASLEGESIEDVGIATGRAWRIGVKREDNGVLLIIAPVERRVRIEVGKGAEGALTDLQSNDIIRQRIKPHLAQGHEDYRAAVSDGVAGIMAALGSGGTSTVPPRPAPATGSSAAIGLLFLLLVFLVPFILFIVIMRAIVSAFTSHGPSAGRGWASGGTWSNDSSWSSSNYDSGWGGGGGGDSGSGFSGGGGDFGGGGSSDSF
jgi:uncharacterized protein